MGLGASRGGTGPIWCSDHPRIQAQAPGDDECRRFEYMLHALWTEGNESTGMRSVFVTDMMYDSCMTEEHVYAVYKSAVETTKGSFRAMVEWALE